MKTWTFGSNKSVSEERCAEFLGNPWIPSRICYTLLTRSLKAGARKTLCSGCRPDAVCTLRVTARPPQCPGCHSCPHSTDPTFHAPIVGTCSTWDAKFLSAHAQQGKCSLGMLDTHWPPTAWTYVLAYNNILPIADGSFEQIHDVHLVDQWLKREPPSKSTVQFLHTPGIFPFVWFAKCKVFISLVIRYLGLPLSMVFC